jgi:hypothetical protein
MSKLSTMFNLQPGGGLTVELSDDDETLVITVDPDLLARWREDVDDDPELGITDLLDSTNATGGLVGNCELEWLDPADTGDLTDAPMIGIAERDDSGEVIGIVARWAFMDYQVRDPRDDLLTGRLELTGGCSHPLADETASRNYPLSPFKNETH